MNAVDFDPVLLALQSLFVSLHPQIVKHWGDRTVSTIKSDGSLVTIIDKMIEARLADFFKQYIPEAYFLGEESYDPTPGSENQINEHPYLIVVDPIDGTRNYVEGRPSFGTLIGIYQQAAGELTPVCGIVYHPLESDKLAQGSLGKFTWSSNSGVTTIRLSHDKDQHSVVAVPVPTRSPTISSLPRVVSPYRRNAFVQDLDIIRCDVSIVDLMLPIYGQAEATISRSRFWDIGGPAVLALRSGLKIYDLTTREEIATFTTRHFVQEGARKWELRDHILITSPELFSSIEIRR